MGNTCKKTDKKCSERGNDLVIDRLKDETKKAVDFLRDKKEEFLELKKSKKLAG